MQPVKKQYNYLALGDSYTIGEKVTSDQSFPHQAVALLKGKGFHFNSPEIIATTGWSTDELEVAIEKATLRKRYDFVTLLIGVNDQYRQRPIGYYPGAFEALLARAIGFTGNDSLSVAVLSIPDWGVTPYAEGRDREKIAAEINEYNRINHAIAQKYQVSYIDVTPATRRAVNDTGLLAEDGLHPSGKAYAEWAAWLADVISARLHKRERAS